MTPTKDQIEGAIQAADRGLIWIGSTSAGRHLCDRIPDLADLLRLAALGLENPEAAQRLKRERTQ